MKNPHAVALGRLGGAKGGPARAKSLSPRRRREIAKRAGAARARALSPSKRQELARRAAAARWGHDLRIVTAADAPPSVRRLLRNYGPERLHWAKRDHKYVIVRAILLRGDDHAVQWLRSVLSARRTSVGSGLPRRGLRRNRERETPGRASPDGERHPAVQALRLQVAFHSSARESAHLEEPFRTDIGPRGLEPPLCHRPRDSSGHRTPR
jgi:hypothetical protein